MANPNCPIPNNINPLSPTGFKLSITKLPDLTYFCQEANLPEVELPSIEMPTSFSAIGVPGDLIHFGNLTVQFLVDENKAMRDLLRNLYKERQWMQCELLDLRDLLRFYEQQEALPFRGFGRLPHKSLTTVANQ